MGLDFNILTILYFILVVIDIVLFHWGLFVLVLAKGDVDEMQKGRRILFSAIIILFVLFVIFLVYWVSYIIKSPKIPSETEGSGSEFPPPIHIKDIPPAPNVPQLEL